MGCLQLKFKNDYFEMIKKKVVDFNKNFEPKTLFKNEM